MIYEIVEEVLSVPVEEVISTPLSLKLLRCISLLYLQGNQPRTCSSSQRKYYQQLSLNGLKMAEKFDKRTNKPKWNGLRYIPSTHRHWNSELITDDEALMLIDKGHLKESDFEILPKKDDPVPDEKIQKDFEERHTPKSTKKAGRKPKSK